MMVRVCGRELQIIRPCRIQPERDLYIIDVSNKSNPITIGTHPTPNAFTHNAWVSDDGDYVFTTDEQSGAYLTAYDVSDLNNIQEVDRIQ